MPTIYDNIENKLAPALTSLLEVAEHADKRNIDRFPVDFMFRLNSEELAELQRSRSQFVTLNRGHNIKYAPSRSPNMARSWPGWC